MQSIIILPTMLSYREYVSLHFGQVLAKSHESFFNKYFFKCQKRPKKAQKSGFRVNEDFFKKNGPGAILRFLSPIIPQNLNFFKLSVPEISCHTHTHTETNGHA